MILLNFAHPLTPAQQAAIEQAAGGPITAVLDEPTQTQIADERPLAEQITAVLDGFGLTPAQWQGEAILVNLPGYAPAAGAALAALHGRMGYFPAILRLRPVPGALPRQYEVAELLDLQGVRDDARRGRGDA